MKERKDAGGRGAGYLGGIISQQIFREEVLGMQKHTPTNIYNEEWKTVQSSFFS